jgi:predicted outer membrane repeat protein
MAGSNRRFTLAAIALPLLLLVISGRARANIIFVNTLDGGSDAAPLCTLPDAIAAANSTFAVNGCSAGSGDDQIVIGLTGTIFVDADKLPLNISDESLEISTFGDGPVVIDGGLNFELAGGIFNVEAGSMFLGLTSLTFAHGNSGNGGAIFAGGTDLDIRNCLFVNNQAGAGGAILASTGTIEITNSTFFRNGAPNLFSTIGGAVLVVPGVTLKLTNSTFEDNSARSGSAIANLGTADVKGTIFADHLDEAGTGVVFPMGNCFGAITDENYNISVDSSCAFTMASSLNNVTAAALALDPLGLQYNGGASDTVALESGSDAIGRIPVANCTDQSSPTPQPLETDQRLFGRPDPGDPTTCDSGAYEFDALAAYTLNSERVQIARSTTLNSDKVNMGLTFTANGDADCDFDEDALNDGVGIGLFQGTCATLPFDGLFLGLSPFVVHTVNHQQYGTLFQTNGTVTVSARMVALPPPVGLCGKWTLNLEVGGLNTNSPSVNLGGNNPFAVLISDGSDIESCFDITNAIVGNQIPTPPHGARRRVRRGR